MPRKQIKYVLFPINLQRTYHSNYVVNDWGDKFGMISLSG